MSSTTEDRIVTVWEFKSGAVNDFAPLVFASDRDLSSGMFDMTGHVLNWPRKPKVEIFVEPGKKKPKPLADISALTPGALALNDKAKSVLAPFLEHFGQFLEMDCQGESRWFYNVTNLVSCIDEAKSDRRPSGSISKEAFFPERIPTEAAVFKDPLTAAATIYVNDTAKSRLEQLIEEAGIVGAAFVEPGPAAKKPRPRA